MLVGAVLEGVGSWIEEALRSDLMGPILAALLGALVAQYFAHHLSILRDRRRDAEELTRARRSDVLAALDRSMTAATHVFNLMELNARLAVRAKSITGQHAELRSRLMELAAANMILRARLGDHDETYQAFRACLVAGNEFDAQLHGYAAGIEPLARAFGKAKAGRWFQEAGIAFENAFTAALEFVDSEFGGERSPTTSES